MWRTLTDSLHLSVRLLVAVLLAALLGYQRQSHGKTAGLRTHMLVALGSATLVVATFAMGGSYDDVARVVQGAAAGIGFIGAGAIVKLSEREIVRGLTTAASLWSTAALGVAAGMGSLSVAVVSALTAWLILSLLGRLEPHVRRREHGRDPAARPGGRGARNDALYE